MFGNPNELDLTQPIKGGSFEDIEYDYPKKDTIRVYIPPVPQKHLIQNFDLPKKQQKFKRQGLPDWWEEEYEKEAEEREINDAFRSPRCEQFRLQCWEKREKGHWVFINGKPVYLPGKYWYYLEWCENDNGYPEFREVSRRKFLFTTYCFQLETCLATLEIGPRGFGKTTEVVAVTLEHLTKTPGRRHGAIQSKTEGDAKNVIFDQKMVPVYMGLPEFFQPISNHGTKPEKKLSFFRDTTRGKKAKKVKVDKDAELKNTVYYVAAKETTLDGGTFAIIIQDEVGKCLGLNTPVLMYDGSVKMVQDIIKGELIMGDDSTPRKVFGVCQGSEKMYEIVPKKGMKWTCNESHILSLKLCSNNIIKGYNKNDTINITIPEYKNLTPTQKKHLMLYRVGIEYKEQHHEIPSYLLGLWLGDGRSNRMRIYNQDIEVENYLEEYAGSNNYELLKVKEKSNCWAYSFKDKAQSNKSKKCIISNFLLSHNLKNNKHIPRQFLIDSRENRLQLLAALIDTDGYKSRTCYEIVQKSETLANDIEILCNSLGFYCSKKEKVAAMKREDGSIYNCKVYRLTLFGDLYEIPCLVDRKKTLKKESYHINRRNALRSGFSIKNIGQGDYYGFSIDGNKLFVLGDFTITHNTDSAKEADVHRRWYINKHCVYRNNEKRGMMLGTSTVEDLKKGGAQAKALWAESDPKKLDENGYTISGGYKFFVSALDVKCFDEFGYSDRAAAEKKIDAERRALKDKPKDLQALIRKFPKSSEEAFMEDGEHCEFNAFILNHRIEELELREPVVTGNLDWINQPDGSLNFNYDPNGRFQFSEFFKNFDHSNQVAESGTTILANERQIKTFRPLNDLKYRIGTDPVDHGVETVDARVSDSAAYCFRLFDGSIDREENVYTVADCNGDDLDYKIGKTKWQTHMPIVQYVYRNDDPTVYYEDMIKLCRFFGCSILAENNKVGIINHFRNRGYGEFLMYRPAETFTTDNGKQNTVGVPGSSPLIQQWLGLTKSYVNNHGHRIPFLFLCRDLLRFRKSNIRIHDATVAFGTTQIALLGEAKQVPVLVEARQLFRTYTPQGNTVTLNR